MVIGIESQDDVYTIFRQVGIGFRALDELLVAQFVL